MVTLDFPDHVVTEETKVTWEREVSRVTWDLQVQEEEQEKKVNQVTRA